MTFCFSWTGFLFQKCLFLFSFYRCLQLIHILRKLLGFFHFLSNMLYIIYKDIYIYICMYIYIYIYIYTIYIYIERERDRDRERYIYVYLVIVFSFQITSNSSILMQPSSFLTLTMEDYSYYNLLVILVFQLWKSQTKKYQQK